MMGVLRVVPEDYRLLQPTLLTRYGKRINPAPMQRKAGFIM